jgi:parallel beta-helix repeat protein
VSSAGSNQNDGTIGSPWQTIRFALSRLAAGDTLYIRGGTYTGGDNTIDSQTAALRSGTSWSNAITIAGYSGEPVTIQPPDNVSGIRLTTGAPAYFIFQDFTIDMANSTRSGGAGGADGVYLSSGAHHNRFQRVEVKNNAASGFQFSSANGNSPFNEVLNCAIHDNGSAPGINRGYGLYISTSDNLFEGNDVYGNGGYGFHLYDSSGPFNVARNIIRNNSVHDNGTHGGNNYGIAIAWGDGNQIEGNRIHGNRGGILVYTNSTNTKVLNNTIHDNGPLESILVQYATGTIIQDNLIDAAGIVDMGNGTQVLGNR